MSRKLAKIEAAGFANLLDAVCISGVEGVSKPNPVILHKTIIQAGGDPEIEIGHHPETIERARPIFHDVELPGQTLPAAQTKGATKKQGRQILPFRKRETGAAAATSSAVATPAARSAGDDIYGLGATLHAFLTGRDVFAGADDPEGPFPPVRDLAPQVSVGIAERGKDFHSFRHTVATPRNGGRAGRTWRCITGNWYV